MPEIDPKLELRVYVEYLEISKGQCPPNYYTLLAIPNSIRDTSSIDKAAKKRAERLRRGLPAELHPAGRKILKRLARARICLLDADARAAYDISIGFKVRVDRTGDTKKEVLHTTKSAKGNRPAPSTSAVGSHSPSQRISPPPHKLETENNPPEIEGFDDLLSEIPDVESASARPPPSKGVKSKPRTDRPRKSTKPFPVVPIILGGLAILCVVMVLMFSFPSGDNTSSKITIPELPLAKRINDNVTVAEYTVGDGVFSIGCNLPLPTDEAIHVFLTEGNSSLHVVFELKFNGLEQEGGFFKVAGKPVQPQFFVDDAQVLELQQDNPHLKIHSPGQANFVVHFNGQEIRFSFQVTELALPEEFGKKQVIELLGFADKKDTEYDSDGGGRTEHWYFDEYPTIVILPDRSKIKHLAPPVLELPVDQSLPETLVTSTPIPEPKYESKPEPEPEPIEPLPIDITLPKLRGPESTLSDNMEAPVDLGSIGSLDLSKLYLTLDHPSAMKDGGDVKFEISRSIESKETPLWDIRLRSTPKRETDEKSVLDDVGSGLNELIGKIHIEGYTIDICLGSIRAYGLC